MIEKVLVKSVFLLAMFGFFSVSGFAQEAAVKVSLSPAGSFVGKTKEIAGAAETTDDKTYTAKDIVVTLKNIDTGISLRDKHTKEHLEVEKFPTAKLISATGSEGKGKGIIEIRGVQHEVEGTYVVKDSKLTAEFPINFPDYNIKGIRYAGLGVKDKGTITVTVPVKKGTAAAKPPESALPPAKPQAPAKKK